MYKILKAYLTWLYPRQMDRNHLEINKAYQAQTNSPKIAFYLGLHFDSHLRAIICFLFCLLQERHRAYGKRKKKVLFENALKCSKRKSSFKKVYLKNNKSWPTFAMKGHVVNILGSVGHTVPATTAWLSYCREKETIEISKQMSVPMFQENHL